MSMRAKRAPMPPPARPRDGGDPVLTSRVARPFWIPAFAGMSGVCDGSFHLIEAAEMPALDHR